MSIIKDISNNSVNDHKEYFWNENAEKRQDKSEKKMDQNNLRKYKKNDKCGFK